MLSEYPEALRLNLCIANLFEPKLVSEAFTDPPQNVTKEQLIQFVYGCVLKGPLEPRFVSPLLTPNIDIPKTKSFTRSQIFDHPPSNLFALIANAANALEDWPHRYFHLMNRVNCHIAGSFHETDYYLPLIPKITGNWPNEAIPFVNHAYEEYEKNAGSHQATYMAVSHEPRLVNLAKIGNSHEEAALVDKTDILRNLGSVPATSMPGRGSAFAQAKAQISMLRSIAVESYSFRESCRGLGMHPRILAHMSSQGKVTPYMITMPLGPEHKTSVWRYSPQMLREIMENLWWQSRDLVGDVPDDLITMEDCYRILKARNVTIDRLLWAVFEPKQQPLNWFRINLYAPYLQPDKFSEFLVSKEEAERVPAKYYPSTPQ